MNNDYYNCHRDCYGPRNDMCFDNKGMVTTVQVEHISPTSPPSALINSVESCDRRQLSSTKSSCKPGFRIYCPYAINTTIALFVLSILLLLELGYFPGHKQGFNCKDPTISHKYRGDTVSVTALLTGTFLIPIAVLITAELISKNSLKQIRVKIIWLCYKECVIGVTLVLFLTELGKVVVGEHRPHFLDICQPTENQDCTEGTFISTYICTTNAYSVYFITDSSRSFPSGHASTSVYISLFCVYVVHNLMRTIHLHLLKPLLVACCLTWCLVCSLTRITDNRHHWWDVLAGTVLGVCGAFYTLFPLHYKIQRIDVDKVSISTTTLLDIKDTKNTGDRII